MLRNSAAPRFTAVRRGHAADEVFVKLAEAVLDGTLAVGSTLPPERMLAERFGVSRIIARQAVHRLADMGLVRVRQGGGTVVLDAADSHDLRVLELTWRFGPHTPSDLHDFVERQVMQGHAMLYLAQRRGTRADFDRIAEIVEAYAQAGASEGQLPEFERRFWRAIALAGGNRLFVWEHRFWSRVLATNPRVRHPVLLSPQQRMAGLRELVRRLRAGEDATRLFLKHSEALLASLKSHSRRKEKR